MGRSTPTTGRSPATTAAAAASRSAGSTRPTPRSREAVAASCAIPGFYRPVRIGGRRYVDGGVCSASNLDLLAGRGLDLVVCLNPLSSGTAPGEPDSDGGGPLERFGALDPRDWLGTLSRQANGRRLAHEAGKVRGFGTEVAPDRADLRGPRGDGPQPDERQPGAPPAGDRDRRPHRPRAAAPPRACASCCATCPPASRTRSAGPPDRPPAGRSSAPRRSRGERPRRREHPRRGPDGPRDRSGGRAGSEARPRGGPRRARPGLHPRDAAAPLDAREPLLPGQRARARADSRDGSGAAGRQPLGRQPDAGHDRLHARLQHLLRRRAALPPARPQPRPVGARARLPAQVRDGRGHAGQRRAGARPGRRPARLPGRRLRGPPAVLGVGRRGLRRPQGLHPARQAEAACRSCRWCPSAARRRRSS